jgi:hypothetical protein
MPAPHRVSLGLGACALLPGLVALLLLGGCGDDRKEIYSTNPTPVVDEKEKALRDDLAKLARGKDLDDPANSVVYDEAKRSLISRGATIETRLIETLGSSTDWGVRLGVVEVLSATGTKRCVEALIGALEDPQPLIAYNADSILRVMCHHREIPEHGKPTGANGLPPVPLRDPKALALDADEKIWVAWYGEHHQALHKAWADWWSMNKDKTKID